MRPTFRALAVAALLLTSLLAAPVLATQADTAPDAGSLAAGSAETAGVDGSDSSDGVDGNEGIDRSDGVDRGAPADVLEAPTRDVESDGVREDGESLAAGDAARRRSTAADGDRIHLRNALRQAPPNGEYAVTTRVTMPDRVTELRLTLPSQAMDVQATGFTKQEGEWVWDGETDRPTLEYRMPANRTTQDGGPLAAEGNYLFVDVGDWAIVRPPGIGAGWAYTGSPVTLDRRNVVDGDGAASGGMAYLGDHETFTHEANGQEFRLIVPEAADLEESPAAIFDSLGHAAGTLQVGDRDATVFLIAAPTGQVGWGVRGLQTGDTDAWVRDSEGLSSAENVWVHEYVHTRQSFRTTASARWFTEATATYYAALLPLERSLIGFDAFRSVLAQGEEAPQAAAVLADPGTWENNAQYTKGALVAGEIDRRIRLATNSSRTLTSVFRDMNAHDDRLRNEDVLGAVADASTTAVTEEAERLTTTEATANAWNREAHNEAFGQQPARIVFSIDDADAVVANGEFGTRSIDRNPVRLVTGETLRVAVTVENTGGTTGEYDLTLVVDGETVATRTGRLNAGNATVERFEQPFENPGEYQVLAGGQRLDVVVADPAALVVSDLTVEPETVTAGETVTISGIARNDATVPGTANVTLTVDGERTVLEPVRLAAEDETVFQRTVTLETAGEVTIRVGNRSRTISVTDPESTPSTTPTTASGEAIPGFGLAVAGVALLVASLLAVRGGRPGR